MNAFDLALFCVLAIFAVLGALRGFVRSVFFLGNWLIASTVAWFFAAPASAALDGVIEAPVVRTLSAFVVVFLVVFVAGVALSGILHRVMESMPALKASNRVLGGFIGVCAGVAVVVLAFLLAGLTSLPQDSWWRHSTLAPFFESFAAYIGDFLPADIARHIRYG
ncbi:MAG: CvpA family protein [Acidiferrobacterales bacterium]